MKAAGNYALTIFAIFSEHQFFSYCPQKSIDNAARNLYDSE